MAHEKHVKRSEASSSRPDQLDDPFIDEDEGLQEKSQGNGKHRFVLHNVLS